MHFQRNPNKPIRGVSGSFDTIKLDFSAGPPLREQEKYKHKANYPTTLAKIHVLLNGKDAAQQVPSGHVHFILISLLHGVPLLLQGKSITADWVSDPWQFDVHGYPNRNRVAITLHVPEQWVAMSDVNVPLDQFGQEIIKLGQRWRKYLEQTYEAEVHRDGFNQQYINFVGYLNTAIKSLSE